MPFSMPALIQGLRTGDLLKWQEEDKKDRKWERRYSFLSDLFPEITSCPNAPSVAIKSGNGGARG
jgi:hypothetical protein